MLGNLYIVATPIGNLADISMRAIETLKKVDFIAAEDTRHSRILLGNFAINTKIISYHEHNENKQSGLLIKKILKGQSIALICDAGSPLINDPGYKLVCMAHDHHIKTIPIPGPSAIVTALSVCGLPTNKFIFEGYLPTKKEACQSQLIELKNDSRTLVFYETPHRIIRTIKILQEVFGNKRRVTIAKEITKKFEQIVRGSVEEISLCFENGNIKDRGEFVILIEGEQNISTSSKEVLRVNQILSEHLSHNIAAKLTAKITGEKKNEVYKLTLNKNDN